MLRLVPQVAPVSPISTSSCMASCSAALLTRAEPGLSPTLSLIFQRSPIHHGFVVCRAIAWTRIGDVR